MHRLVLALALTAAVAACAGPAPHPTAAAFDGNYQGTQANIHVSALSCSAPATQPGAMTVQGGQVMWTMAGATTAAPIMADGGFAAQNGTVYLSGKITNNNMVARVNTGSCHQVYDLRRG
jgi:hypothetical protein